MASLNRMMIIGRLGRDPESKTASNGSSVCRFSVATDESYTDRDGTRQEKTEWHNVVCFGRTGELCLQYLHKGSLAYIDGRVQTRKWTDQAGQERSSVEVVANTVQFLDPRGSAPAAAPQPISPAPAPLFSGTADDMDEMPF